VTWSLFRCSASTHTLKFGAFAYSGFKPVKHELTAVVRRGSSRSPGAMGGTGRSDATAGTAGGGGPDSDAAMDKPVTLPRTMAVATAAPRIFCAAARRRSFITPPATARLPYQQIKRPGSTQVRGVTTSGVPYLHNHHNVGLTSRRNCAVHSIHGLRTDHVARNRIARPPADQLMGPVGRGGIDPTPQSAEPQRPLASRRGRWCRSRGAPARRAMRTPRRVP